MTTEQKIGQLLMPAFRKNSEQEYLWQLDEKTRSDLETYQPGGVIFFSENINTAEQVVGLINEFQESSTIPLLIAVDEEGGLVSRLTANGKIDFPVSPGNGNLGSRGDPEEVAALGKDIAKSLKALGFSMNMAPVADVNTNPNNPVIGARSFGAEPHMVAALSVAMAHGMLQEQVIPVLKHFPGHGDTEEDTHLSKVTVPHNRQRFETVEWIPFIAGIQAGLPVIMTAHLQTPALSADNRPATLSYTVLTEILRNELNFKGVIVTDALEMAAVSNDWNAGDAAVESFLAGADILLMPASLEEAYFALLHAVQTGLITQIRLDESVLRILRLKEIAGLSETT
jgi:beta-N-acetylhexosaminidase